MNQKVNHSDFLLHAPPIPVWFHRKEWKEDVIKKDPFGRCHIAKETKLEDHLDHLVRWRFTYAEAMEKERLKRVNESLSKPIVKFDPPPPQEINDNGKLI